MNRDVLAEMEDAPIGAIMVIRPVEPGNGFRNFVVIKTGVTTWREHHDWFLQTYEQNELSHNVQSSQAHLIWSIS